MFRMSGIQIEESALGLVHEVSPDTWWEPVRALLALSSALGPTCKLSPDF